MARVNVYQIYYDEKSKLALDPAFIPLDNVENKRPDWFEFWPIRNFLKREKLDEDSLYGFLSPSFQSKTGLRGSQLLDFLNQAPPTLDVVLFSHSWDQIAYFKNVFEQGEYCHPGLLSASSGFFRSCNRSLDVRELVGNSMNSVFSNYFVAKPNFWREWLSIADKLWELCEHQIGDLTDELNSSGCYKSGGHDAALKVFVQERIACVLLSEKKFSAINVDFSYMSPVNNRLFTEDLRTKKLLMACDTLKLEFEFSSSKEFDRGYWSCRHAINFNDFFGRRESLLSGG